MKVVKKTAEYTVYQKRNNRYGVKGLDNKWVNADDKVKILLAEGLIKVSEPAAPVEEAPEAAEEAPADTTEESAEAPAEEETKED